MKRTIQCLVALSLFAAFSGCAVLGLKSQNQKIQATGFVSLRIEKPPQSAPTYVLALDNKGQILGAQSVGTSGVATFAIPIGQGVRVIAFSDINRNRALDVGEPCGVLDGIVPVPLGDPSQRSRVHDVRLGIRGGGTPVGLSVPDSAGAAVEVALGEIAKISDARFNPDIGVEGLWKPGSSLFKGALGLYFIEPYDASRTPVLFVHGIGGSPRDFTKLISSLDTSHYQAWFFTYPSGFRLEKVSTALATMLELVRKQHGVRHVYLVAHSMGGVVARSAILRMADSSVLPPVEKFISIATPWGGHAAAKSGLRALKYPVPAWIDMAPGSAFLKSLWSRELPKTTRYWLLFGYYTKQMPWLTLNNDTVIDMRSALLPAAQDEAFRVFGIEKSHEQILSSPETIRKMKEFLAGP